MNTKPMTEWSEQEIKAMAYEQTVALTRAQSNLQVLETELRRRASLPKPAEETKAE